MNANKKVLACVDQSRYADYVADYAAWAAKNLDAPLEFLHVLNRHPQMEPVLDHSGAIGMDAQENLLTELSEQDAIRSREAREQGRIFLNRLRQRAIAAGVDTPDVRQRHGELEDTLVEQESKTQLFVLGRRGEAAETTERDIGRHVEWVARALHRPILTVTNEFKEPRRVMIAFDGSAVTRRGVRLIAASQLFRGLPVHLLMSGKGGSDARKQLDWAQGVLEHAGFDAPATLKPGDAETTIAHAVDEQNIDMLIMGAFAHSWFRSLFFGSKTSDLLRSAKVPTLLLR